MKSQFIGKSGKYQITYSTDMYSEGSIAVVCNGHLQVDTMKRTVCYARLAGLHIAELEAGTEVFLSIDGAHGEVNLDITELAEKKEIKKIPSLRVALEFWLRNHPEWSSSDWSHLEDETRSDYGSIIHRIRPFCQNNHWDEDGDCDYDDGYFYDIIVDVNCRNKTPEIKFNQAAVLAFWMMNN